MKKTLSMVIVLAMLLSAMLGIVSFADTTEATEPQLEVSQATLEFNTAVYLYIAVNYAEVGDANGITLQITNNKTGESVVLTPNTKISVPANSVAFKYDTLGAKNMGDELTLQALKDGKASGEAKTFSVLEYSLKATSLGDAKLDKLMEAMISYGMTAQQAYNHEGTYDLSKEWGMLVFGGATVSKHIALAGSTTTRPAAVSELGSSAVLYGADLEVAPETLTVEKGMSRYFYLGSNRTDYNLDFTTGSIAAGTVIIDGATASSSAAATKGVYSTLAGGASMSSATNAKKWAFTSSEKKASNDYAEVVEIDGVKCLRWAIDDNSSGSGQINVDNGLPTGGNTTFTLSFTIGKVAGKKLISGPRFRGTVNGANMNGSVYAWATSGDNAIKLWNQAALTVTFEDGEFKTIHMVVDPVKNRVSCYADDYYLGEYTLTGNDTKLLRTSTSYRLDWTTFSKGAQLYVKRAVVTMGDIFE